MAEIIPFDKREGLIWMDGKLCDWGDAKIHILSHALHYGSCVFEGERAYDGKIFRSLDHSRRLIESARTLDMDLDYSAEEIDALKYETLKANGLTNAYLRPVVWRGTEMMAISAQQTKIHMAIAVWDWPSYFSPELKAKGIKLQTSKWLRPSEKSAPVHAKAAGLYMICTLSKHEAERNGCQDALMLDYRGYLAEATGANLFLVIDGEIHTPTPDCFLNGLTRQTVIGLAEKLGYKVNVRHIMPEELAKAEEVFLTGSAAEITPVGQIDDFKFKPAAVTHSLMDAYTGLVNGG